MSNIKEEILRYLAEYPPAYQVFEMLLQAGDVYVMGDCLENIAIMEESMICGMQIFALTSKDRKYGQICWRLYRIR